VRALDSEGKGRVEGKLLLKKRSEAKRREETQAMGYTMKPKKQRTPENPGRKIRKTAYEDLVGKL